MAQLWSGCASTQVFKEPVSGVVAYVMVSGYAFGTEDRGFPRQGVPI
jgi:hypothetical protein